tara:strand:+ start:1308 stop:2909 length:1602 start_codon:yes stop_codon:yes gene_type:complete
LGLFGAAFSVARTAGRVGGSVGRSAFYVGGSVARGRVPNISIGPSFLGSSIRVGTKGIKLRTPIAALRVGSGGFTATVGNPGLAHISLRPLTPSGTIGIGPGRLDLGRTSSIGFRQGMIAMGVSTKPLFWAQIGPFDFGLPGEYKRPGRSWHEEADSQWQPYYDRRPPSISAELHDLIRQVEASLFRLERHVPVKIKKPKLTARSITRAEKHSILQSVDQKDFSEINWTKWRGVTEAFQERKREKVLALLDEKIFRMGEVQELQKKVDEAFSLWEQGENHEADFFIITSIFQAEECSARIVKINEKELTILVFVPSSEGIIHPSKPGTTAGGAKTIKKKTKKETKELYESFVWLQSLQVAEILCHYLKTNKGIRLVTVSCENHVAELGELPVLFDRTMSRDEYKELLKMLESYGSANRKILRSNRELFTPLKSKGLLKKVMPEVVKDSNGEIRAINVDVEETEELSSPVFWSELSAALEELEPQESKLPRHNIMQEKMSDSSESVIEKVETLERLYEAGQVWNADRVESKSNP